MIKLVDSIIIKPIYNQDNQSIQNHNYQPNINQIIYLKIILISDTTTTIYHS